MIKLKQAVIVEGKYDKIKLSSIIDTLIIETDGFQIFKDKEKLGYIRLLAETRGVIILTDSDSAGFLILSALNAAGVTADKNERTEATRRVTKADLYDDGLSGGKNSAELREKLLSELGLPKRISANAIPKALEYLVTYDEYKAAVEKIKKA